MGPWLAVRVLSTNFEHSVLPLDNEALDAWELSMVLSAVREKKGSMESKKQIGNKRNSSNGIKFLILDVFRYTSFLVLLTA